LFSEVRIDPVLFGRAYYVVEIEVLRGPMYIRLVIPTGRIMVPHRLGPRGSDAARNGLMSATLTCRPPKADRVDGLEERRKRMKAVQFAEYGGPEVLQIAEVEEPHAGPGQLRIAVRAAGVNGIDWKIRAGYMGGGTPLSRPSGTGTDAAGVVDEVGDGVSDVAVGDEGFGSGSATFAEYAVLSSWAKKPAGLSFEEAAGYPIPVETAIRILDQVGVRPGETLLVSGASGALVRPLSRSLDGAASRSSEPPANATRTTCGRWAPSRPPTAPVSSIGCAHLPPTGSTRPSTSPAPASSPS
jgi:hypothetical protein